MKDDFKIHFTDGTTLMHYGKPRRSGRYPFGSGKRPYQGLNMKGAIGRTRLAKKLGQDLSPEQVAHNKYRSEDIKIPKGSTVQHISVGRLDKIRPGQLYATFDERDMAEYASLFGAIIKEKQHTPMKVVMKALQNINVPSSSNQKKIFDSLMQDNKNQIMNDLTDYCHSMNMKVPVTDNKIYNMFIASLERPSKSQSLFYEKLTKNGYNGVLDEYDRKETWMQARAPIIVYDAINKLGDIKVSELNDSALLRELDKYLKAK